MNNCFASPLEDYKDYFVGGPPRAIHLKVLEMEEQLVRPTIDGLGVAGRIGEFDGGRGGGQSDRLEPSFQLKQALFLIYTPFPRG